MSGSIEIGPEGPEHVAEREALLDRVMGPIRFRRASERLREGRLPASGLAFVAMAEDAVVGTVRLWSVRACGLQGALLLGPLAVDERLQGQSLGAGLMRHAIGEAHARGHAAVILVGDAPYYGRFGFSAYAARRLAMPGPFERHRLLGLALEPGALDRAHGTLRPAGAALPAPALPLAA